VKKFNSLDELETTRKKVDSKFKDGMPTYLTDYFDKEFDRITLSASYKAAAVARYSHTDAERYEYKKKKEEEFWEKNDYEIVKSFKAGPTEFNMSFKEPVRNPIQPEERDLSPEELRVLVKLCENDLYLFAIRYFPHYLKRPSSKLHRFLYLTLSRDLNKYAKGVKWAIAAPRANAKSTLVSGIFPIWCLCYEKKQFIILLSDTLSQAEDFLYDIKQELEFNEKLKRDFPKVTGKGPIWRTNEIVTNNTLKILALGTGQKIRGRKFGVHRPDLVIGDDIENSDMVRSEVQREFIRYEWFNKEVIFAGGEEGSSTDFFIVGTSIGKLALLNALLDPDQYPEWKGMRFRAVEKFHDLEADELWEQWTTIYKDRFDPERKDHAREFFEKNKELMLKGAIVLWPDGDPYYGLMEYKLSNLSGFLCEKQNEPVDTSKVYVTEKELHFAYFNVDNRISQSIERGIDRGLVFGALDPSLGKKSKKGDFSVIITIVRDPVTGLIFVVDIDMKRRSVDQQIADVLKFHEKYRYKLFAVETNAFQYVVADSMRKLSKETGAYIPIEEIINYQDKKMRIEGIVPFLKDGTIMFDTVKKKANNMYARGIEQICTFTGEGEEEDDVPDALEMAFRIAKAPAYRMITKSTRR
jgi:predicted phage terminase large subunit-like protein